VKSDSKRSLPSQTGTPNPEWKRRTGAGLTHPWSRVNSPPPGEQRSWLRRHPPSRVYLPSRVINHLYERTQRHWVSDARQTPLVQSETPVWRAGVESEPRVMVTSVRRHPSQEWRRWPDLQPKQSRVQPELSGLGILIPVDEEEREIPIPISALMPLSWLANSQNDDCSFNVS